MRPILITVGCLALGSIAGLGSATAKPRQTPADVYFDFDSTALDRGDRADLREILREVRALDGTKVVLDAHADVRGTSPYNVGLSIRRALAIRDHMISRGVAPKRIVVAAYGEDGPRKASFALDRRVTISLTAEPLYSIIDGSGPFVTTVFWDEPVTYAEIEGPLGRKIERTARR